MLFRGCGGGEAAAAVATLSFALRRRQTDRFLPKKLAKPGMNSTPFVRQYDILSNKWGVLLCQKEYQTNDIRRSSREWL